MWLRLWLVSTLAIGGWTATASIGTLLVPVVGVLAAAAMLHEPLGLRQIAALAITLGGVAVALRS